MGSQPVIKVLSVTSECVPLVKTGGLADVAGALPAALAPQGVEMKTLLPGYRAVMAALEDGNQVAEFSDLFGGTVRVIEGTAAGLSLYVLDAPHLFDRDGGPYLNTEGVDWRDNPERFAALSWVAAQLCEQGVDGWQPDILHGHDWQAGFAPYYLKRSGSASKVKSILTIHNMAFHGTVGADRMGFLKLDPADYHADGLEFYGNVSALKAGLIYADKLTTVSPTYANELMTGDFGMGLDGVMRARRADLLGILNGIDTAVWDPASDPLIQPYKMPRGKTKNTAALREEFGLPDAVGPLCVVVSRLSQQKGFDMLLEALPALLDRGGQLALLGSGDKWLEEQLTNLAASNVNVSVKIGYDEALSHRMIAGGDAILVPSRFEPCGLTQLYGLRYGTIPLVALTGGLADTVINANPVAMAKGVATGIQFHPVNTGALTNALDRLCDLFQDQTTWAKMQRNAMAQPVGWETSAASYSALYASLMG